MVTLRVLWFRYVDVELERAALLRLLKTHSATNGHVDRNECWRVFIAAVRYLVLNASVRELVRQGYVMLFVDSTMGSNQLDQALSHNIRYPGLLRFRCLTPAPRLSSLFFLVC